MNSAPRQAPSSLHTLRAITRRQLLMARKRRLLKLLFLGSLLPPIVLTVVVLVRIMAEQMGGMRFEWDFLTNFLWVQIVLVGLLSLGLGAATVVRDRVEDVLFLYATRPVQPWHYTLGKMLAVILPAMALTMLPGLLIPLLNVTVTTEMTVPQGLWMVLKMLLLAGLMGAGFAGVTVGASSLVKSERWALLIILGVFGLTRTLMEAAAYFFKLPSLPLDPLMVVKTLMEALFDGGPHGPWSAGVLLGYFGLGFGLVHGRVKREMIP